jgi:Kef-type K+ transport system membrane component KefB
MIGIRDLLAQHPLFCVGMMLIAGHYLGRGCALIRLPEITGYIFAGILLGEGFTGIVPAHMSASMLIVTEVALGLIALIIGSEFSFVKLRLMGKEVVIVTMLQLAGVFAAVTLAVLLAGLALPFAMLLGAIATASSPAVTVAIVQSLRAQGAFVEFLYGVVALLDAGCVVLFGIVFAVAAGLLGLTGPEISGVALIGQAVAEVLYSVALGGLSGFLLHYAVRRRRLTSDLVLLTLGVTFLFTSVAIIFHLSPLLINMTAGATLVNLSPRHHRLFLALEPLTPPLYALFFVLAGTELQLAILGRTEVLLIGGVYVLVRNLAKYGTVYAGCVLAGMPRAVTRNLGFCMFPQAGVALGLVLLIQASPLSARMSTDQAQLVETLVNVILLSVFANQIIGPPLAKRAVLAGTGREF